MKDPIKIPPKAKLEVLTKVMEQELGYEYTHNLIDKAEMQYAILETNKVLERR